MTTITRNIAKATKNSTQATTDLITAIVFAVINIVLSCVIYAIFFANCILLTGAAPDTSTNTFGLMLSMAITSCAVLTEIDVLVVSPLVKHQEEKYFPISRS